MTYSHHNTTHEHGATLAEYEAKALTQEDTILAEFLECRRPLTPSEIHQRVLANAPLTSVRRAMTNLTKQNLLEKTDIKVQGPYGRPEYAWRLKPKDPKQGELL